MENLSAMRVPATIVALLILGLRVVAAVVGTVVYSGDGVGAPAISAAEIGYRTIDPALVVVTVLLVASCVVVRPVSSARTLARWAVVVVGLSIFVALTLAVLGASRGGSAVGLDTVDTVLLLAVPLLGFVTLVRLAELAPTPTRSDEDAVIGPAAGDSDVQIQPEPAPDPALEPAWQPDVAAGAAWHTAGDAAAGAPASRWGTPGESADWAPRAEAEHREAAHREAAHREAASVDPSAQDRGDRSPDAGEGPSGRTPEDDPAHRWGRHAD